MLLEMGTKIGKARYGRRDNKLFEISILEGDYSDNIDKRLWAAGFRNVGTGGGSYEYEIEAKTKEEVRDKLKRIGVKADLFTI
jgi:hypothetical protein